MLTDLYVRSVDGIAQGVCSESALHVLIEGAKCFLLYTWFHSNVKRLLDFVTMEL